MSAIAKPKRAERSSVGCQEEAAYVDLLRTTDHLARRLVPVIKAVDLSSTQYNVLRILRGAGQELPCGEIANRMVTRDPDITRLLDRLEKRGLISRRRQVKDRRTVLTRITAEGLDLLARLDKPVHEAHARHLGHLSRGQLRQLSELLRAARGEE